MELQNVDGALYFLLCASASYVITGVVALNLGQALRGMMFLGLGITTVVYNISTSTTWLKPRDVYAVAWVGLARGALWTTVLHVSHFHRPWHPFAQYLCWQLVMVIGIVQSGGYDRLADALWLVFVVVTLEAARQSWVLRNSTPWGATDTSYLTAAVISYLLCIASGATMAVVKWTKGTSFLVVGVVHVCVAAGTTLLLLGLHPNHATDSAEGFRPQVRTPVVMIELAPPVVPPIMAA